AGHRRDRHRRRGAAAQGRPPGGPRRRRGPRPRGPAPHRHGAVAQRRGQPRPPRPPTAAPVGRTVPAPVPHPGPGPRAHGPLRGEGPRSHHPGAAPVGRQRAEGPARPRAVLRPGARGGRLPHPGARRGRHRVGAGHDPRRRPRRRRRAPHQRGPRRGPRPLRPGGGDVRGPHRRGGRPRRGRRHRARPPDGRRDPRGGRPVIRLERRVETPRWLDVALPLASFVAALVVGGVVLQLTGHRAPGTYERIVERALTSDGALSGTLVAATPLLFTGLAAAVAFRMNVFNIGGEGQLVLGAIAASGAGLALEGRPGWLIIGAMVVAGAAAGAAWAAIPGALRAFTGTNEIITSLMLNYVAANLATYLIFGSRSFWRSLEGSGATFPTGKRLPPEASWPSLELGGVVVPFGFLLGVAGAVVLLVVLRATRFGFAMRVVADAPAAARYAGIRGRRVVLGVMALSGAAAGIGGASNIGDTRHVLDPRGLNQAGYGYAG